MNTAMGNPARDTPSALSTSTTGPRERVHGTAAVENASHTAKQGEEGFLPHSATGCGSEWPLPAARPSRTVMVESSKPISTERARVPEREDAGNGKTHNFEGLKSVNIPTDAIQTVSSEIPSVGKLTTDGPDEPMVTTTSGVCNWADAVEDAERIFAPSSILSAWQKSHARRFLRACRARIQGKRAKEPMSDGVGQRSLAAKSSSMTTGKFASSGTPDHSSMTHLTTQTGYPAAQEDEAPLPNNAPLPSPPPSPPPQGRGRLDPYAREWIAQNSERRGRQNQQGYFQPQQQQFAAGTHAGAYYAPNNAPNHGAYHHNVHGSYVPFVPHGSPPVCAPQMVSSDPRQGYGGYHPPTPIPGPYFNAPQMAQQPPHAYAMQPMATVHSQTIPSMLNMVGYDASYVPASPDMQQNVARCATQPQTFPQTTMCSHPCSLPAVVGTQIAASAPGGVAQPMSCPGQGGQPTGTACATFLCTSGSTHRST